MNKLKLFIENFLVYGFGGIISNIIPLIMLPIVTRLMPDSTYFGISDLSNTVVQFGIAVAIMGMYDAMYRMFFEKDENEYKKIVCSTAFVFTLTMSLTVFAVMLICKDLIAKYFFGGREYAVVVYLSAAATLVGATNGIISAPTRMQNKRKIFLITNTVSPIISYSVSMPLLITGHYLTALPLAAVISALITELAFAVLNRSWFVPIRFDKKILKQLLVIAIPLFPNFLIYWVFNSSDKVMITNLLNVGEAGIYSVGSKLGQCSQLIYTAFAGGWQFFAFSTMKEENQVKSNSLVFEYLGIISFTVAAFVCVFSYPIYRLLFVGDYVKGYIIAPYLFLAPLLQMLFQVAANQFLVVKKTWPNLLILSAGAAANIIINFTLIPKLGIEGASIATLIGYIISDIICAAVLCKMHLMVISPRFIIAALLMAVYFVIWRLIFDHNTIAGILCALFVSCSFVLLYIKDINKLLKLITKKGGN